MFGMIIQDCDQIFQVQGDRKALLPGIFPENRRGINRLALRKLLLLHAVESLDDLRSPPGNRLEALKGERQGQHSLRINDQFRICFIWQEDSVYDVEIVEYH
jgi:proteic killer suppression protein